MSADEWELSPDNVDVGGCQLENPMDLISLSYEALYGDGNAFNNGNNNDGDGDGDDDGGLPEMDYGDGDGNDGLPQPGLSVLEEAEHAGFISELQEGMRLIK